MQKSFNVFIMYARITYQESGGILAGQLFKFCIIGLLTTITVPSAQKSMLSSSASIQADRIFEDTRIINFSAIFTREPEDAATTHNPISSQSPDYRFPINHIRRVQGVKGRIRLEGIIYVRGNASVTAQPLLNKFFTNAGGMTNGGTHYLINIRFEPAPATVTNALEINWLGESELSMYSSNESKLVVGLTQLGGNIIKINPIYADARSMKSAFAKWSLEPRQLRDTIKHTRGVFAHEVAHAMGLSHMRNQTNSILSYAYGRRVNAADGQAICLLVTNGDRSLCPD